MSDFTPHTKITEEDVVELRGKIDSVIKGISQDLRRLESSHAKALRNLSEVHPIVIEINKIKDNLLEEAMSLIKEVKKTDG